LTWKIWLAILAPVLIVSIVIFLFLYTRPNSYKDTAFSLSYPKNVRVEQSSIAGGGKSIIFHLPQGPDYGMTLEIVPSTATNNASIIDNIFRDSGYKESDVVFGGVAGKEFLGATRVDETAFQEKIAIAENHGTIYKLHLIYKLPERDKKADDEFSQILSTLHFNE